MKNFRLYGSAPYSIVVAHGGPGAPGEMKPVAERLAESHGIIEPLQTKNSLNDQIEELKQVIIDFTEYPVVLLGWSWGAWLSYMVTACNPNLVKKLILVGSGPFEASYTEKIMGTRLERLSADDRRRTAELLQKLQYGKVDSDTFREFGRLMDLADAYDPVPHPEYDGDMPGFHPEIYRRVWPEAEGLRNDGTLLELGKTITCPVIAIHGDYDPHPTEGVEKPLSKILKDFRFYLLEHCGHHPWLEKEAKGIFYKILNKELGNV